MNGGLIPDNSAKVERWREHFYAKPATPLLFSAAEFLPPPNRAVSCDPPSEGEVANAIQRLRNNVSEEDGIPTEIYKSYVDTDVLAP
ncbi:hypothetical protein SprV_0100155000 [Sparganum proliferum]